MCCFLYCLGVVTKHVLIVLGKEIRYLTWMETKLQLVRLHWFAARMIYTYSQLVNNVVLSKHILRWFEEKYWVCFPTL